MEEIDVGLVGETTPLPEAFIADEEVDVFSLEALVELHPHSSLLEFLVL